jgi:hypothetical protein
MLVAGWVEGRPTGGRSRHTAMLCMRGSARPDYCLARGPLGSLNSDRAEPMEFFHQRSTPPRFVARPGLWMTPRERSLPLKSWGEEEGRLSPSGAGRGGSPSSESLLRGFARCLITCGADTLSITSKLLPKRPQPSRSQAQLQAFLKSGSQAPPAHGRLGRRSPQSTAAGNRLVMRRSLPLTHSTHRKRSVPRGPKAHSASLPGHSLS